MDVPSYSLKIYLHVLLGLKVLQLTPVRTKKSEDGFFLTDISDIWRHSRASTCLKQSIFFALAACQQKRWTNYEMRSHLKCNLESRSSCCCSWAKKWLFSSILSPFLVISGCVVELPTQTFIGTWFQVWIWCFDASYHYSHVSGG